MVRSVERRIRKSIVLQLDATDCGAACLATVTAYYGGHVHLERIRELTGTGPSGTTLLSILKAGPELGLVLEGFEGDSDSLARMDCPCILHVTTSSGVYHFVISFGLTGDRFLIVDPASGFVRLHRRELEKIWVSRALLSVRRRSDFISRKERSENKRRWLISAIRKDTHALILAVLLGALISTFGLAVALFSQILLDDILPNRDSLKLGVGLALLAFFLITQNAVTAARQLILIRQARSFNNRITTYFIDSLVFLPFPFFAMRKAGDLIARLNDTGRLQRFVTQAVGGVMINALMLITAFSFIISYSLTVGLWSLAGLLLLGICSAFSHQPIVDGQVNVMAARAANESRYVDSMRGIEAIKATNSERFFAGAMKSTFAAFQDAVYRLGRIGLSFNFAAHMSGLFIVLGVLAWGAFFVLEGEMKIGSLVALIQMSNMLIPAAYGLALSNIELQEASVAFDRMYQFSSLEPEYPTSAQAMLALESASLTSTEMNVRASSLHAHAVTTRTTAFPRIDRLTTSNLSFRFPGRRPLLTDVAITLTKGRIVLLVGKTGSGKSTLLRILMRLYYPEGGIVQVDGRDWSTITTDLWRSVAAMVPQQVQIFSGTVVENICMGAVTDLEPVETFCRELGLDGMYRGMPHGYLTLLGEGGVQLSGGQRRLLGLTRALFRRPQILLVDELVAGLDRRSAELAVDILRSKKAHMATLIVTHRAGFRALADHVYVMEDGTVRELTRCDAALRKG